jgi:hypothetical protein
MKIPNNYLLKLMRKHIPFQLMFPVDTMLIFDVSKIQEGSKKNTLNLMCEYNGGLYHDIKKKTKK